MVVVIQHDNVDTSQCDADLCQIALMDLEDLFVNVHSFFILVPYPKHRLSKPAASD